MPTDYADLARRTAVVTGAASGMGAATARLLAKAGTRVALLSRRNDALAALADELGDRALPVATDITAPDAVDAAARTIHETFGPVDLVVNAAGVMLPNPILDGRTDEWQRMIDTNLSGTLHVIRAFTADLVTAAGEGRPADLVVVSSVAAHLATAEYAVYNASKAALSHLAASLRAELSPLDVRVTTIEPGLTRTELGSHMDNPGHSANLATFFDALGGLSPGHRRRRRVHHQPAPPRQPEGNRRRPHPPTLTAEGSFGQSQRRSFTLLGRHRRQPRKRW
jgi:NADP-dependent 3-hydroxy acid dehydrogenase YdfG